MRGKNPIDVLVCASHSPKTWSVFVGEEKKTFGNEKRGMYFLAVVNIICKSREWKSLEFVWGRDEL